jgi:hypothetical protein
MTDRSEAMHPGVRHGSRERGNMLAIILLLIIPLGALAGSSLTLGSRQAAEQNSQRMRSLALLRAESGLDAGLARLIDDASNVEPLLADAAEGEGIDYYVTFEPLGEDGVDNDGDGDADEGDENDLFRLTSTGAVNAIAFDGAGTAQAKVGAASAAKRVRAIARRSDGLPGFPYAVFLGDPLAELDLNGNAFFIDGNDYAADLSPGEEAAVPGIATTNNNPNFIISQLTNQQKDNIQGENGWPSVLTTGDLDLQEFIDKYKNAADVKFVNETQTYTGGDLGDPENDVFKITHVQGNLKISGGCSGAGLMLVEGNLEITGSFDYAGIIICTGQVIFKGGGGTKRVLGTLLVGGDVIEGGQGDEDLELSGTVDVLYSSEIQKKVSTAVSGFTVLGWQEL